MNSEPDLYSRELNTQLQQFTTNILDLVEKSQGDSLLLLSVLRTLEILHRKIREEMFQPSLPNTRKDLYYLIRDIVENGGWPYIERMKLQDLLVNLEQQPQTPNITSKDDHL